MRAEMVQEVAGPFSLLFEGVKQGRTEAGLLKV